MKKICVSVVIFLLGLSATMASPIDGLLERIDKGASSKFIVELVKVDEDFFELDQEGDSVVIRGNTYVNIAVGVDWYLKYYAKVMLTWNCMQAHLPDPLPRVERRERHTTTLPLHYDFNYCTYSYSMAFWDWERWEREIDWMALHGINLPLAVVGQECVWVNLLKRLGYTRREIDSFVAGPAFLAWWAMNNLEGWGGPNPDSWYAGQEKLQKQILLRMREYGMEPVFPGYSGMLPHDANERLGLSTSTHGLWNGFTRPAFLLPTDEHFATIADVYYEELEHLFGKANYYSMDPFHEASDEAGIDFGRAGRAIMDAMKRANPHAVWVVQGWTENPRQEMIESLNTGDLLILDLFSECRPMWGIPSIWQREEGYGAHNWLFCMLENFGGNVGLHGRLDQLLKNFYLTREHPLATHLKGTGLTMEGIENNPMMFELMCELPWRSERLTREEWVDTYVEARYGVMDENIQEAWQLLGSTLYDCPEGNNQQGPHESIFCGRPSLDNFQVSSWSKMEDYYDASSSQEAARLMISVADRYKGNNNFEYDLVDILRQALADEGRVVYKRTIADYLGKDKENFEKDAQEFLSLLLRQDTLLGTRSEFRLGRWTQQARSKGTTTEDSDHYEWNARVQITTWGNRTCADEGGLRDYAHKEWNGLLRDFYYVRWVAYFDMLNSCLDGAPYEDIDFYAIEEPWTLRHNTYTATPEGDPIETAKKIFNETFLKE